MGLLDFPHILLLIVFLGIPLLAIVLGYFKILEFIKKRFDKDTLSNSKKDSQGVSEFDNSTLNNNPELIKVPELNLIKKDLSYQQFGSVFIKITLIVLYLSCLFQMNYSFYQLVKFASLLLFTVLIYIDYKRKKYLLLPFSVIGIIIFNPIYKVILSRETWQTIDKILAIFLLFWVIIEFLWNLEFNKRKKIILREFLIIISSWVLLFLIIFSLQIINNYKAENQKIFKKKIDLKQNSLDSLKRIDSNYFASRNYDLDIKCFIDRGIAKEPLNVFKTYEFIRTERILEYKKSLDKFSTEIQDSSFSETVYFHLNQHFVNIGFSGGIGISKDIFFKNLNLVNYYFQTSSFNEPFKAILINQKNTDNLELELINLKRQNPNWNDDNRDWLDIEKVQSFLIMFFLIIIFCGRYLFYLIKWSISIIKFN